MKAIAILAAGAGPMLATSAGATVYDFSFVGAQSSIVGQLTATPAAGDSDLVTGLTGILTVPGIQYPVTLGPAGWYGPGVPDNIIYPDDDAFGPHTAYVGMAGLALSLVSTVIPGLSIPLEGVIAAVDIPSFPVVDGIYIVPVSDPAVTALQDIGPFTLSAVPEPAPWALMLAGFAGLGAALRTRRETTIAGA